MKFLLLAFAIAIGIVVVSFDNHRQCKMTEAELRYDNFQLRRHQCKEECNQTTTGPQSAAVCGNGNDVTIKYGE